MIGLVQEKKPLLGVIYCSFLMIVGFPEHGRPVIHNTNVNAMYKQNFVLKGFMMG